MKSIHFDKSKVLIFLIIFCLVLLTLCACNKGGTETIRINASNSYGNMTTNVMQKYDLLEKHMPSGTIIEWSSLTSASDMRDALISNKVDIICTSLSTFIINYENDIPLTLISFSGGVPIGLYTNNDKVHNLSDIKDNDQILTKSKSNNGHIAFLIASKDELGDYLALDDQLVLMDEADALSTLSSSKEYIAGNFSFPMTIKAEERGLKQVVGYDSIVNEYGIGSCYMTTEDFYQNNPEIIQGFREAQEEALELIKNDPESVSKAVAEDYGIDYKYVLEAINSMPPSNVVLGYDKLAMVLEKIGLVTHRPHNFSELKNYDEIPH